MKEIIEIVKSFVVNNIETLAIFYFFTYLSQYYFDLVIFKSEKIESESKRKNRISANRLGKLLGANFLLILYYSLILYLYFRGIIKVELLIILTISFILEIENYLKNAIGAIKNPKFFLIKSFYLFLFDDLITVYALFTIDFFSDNTLLRYGLIFLYSLNTYSAFKTFKIQIDFLKLHKSKDEAFKIIQKNKGTLLPGLPLIFFIENTLINIVTSVAWITRLNKSKFNFGLFDTRNRISSFTFNNDRIWFIALCVWIGSIWVLNGINLYTIYYSILSYGIYNLIRSFNNPALAKYFTTVVGETVSLRPAIYDNLLPRVLPNKKRDWQSNIYLKNVDFSFSLFFFNHRFLYDKKRGFVDAYELINESKHILIRFPKEEIPLAFVCEYSLISGLNSPIMIIDVWNSLTLETNMLHGEIKGDYTWLKKRMQILQKLSDEDHGEFSTHTLDHIKNITSAIEMSQFRATLVKSSSFEALRINIDVFENYYTENDNRHIQSLTGKGVYELNTLFRQLHESPSIPSRFIDLLNIAECMMRYLVGICHACKVDEMAQKVSNEFFDTKAISYGSCVDFLARFSKNNPQNLILERKIICFLNHTYTDEENLKSLVGFLKLINPNKKYSSKPSCIELNWWLVEVRNKTRGHGTPSKVPFDFYIALEKLVLFLLHEFNSMGLLFCYRNNLEDIKWTFDLSHGGYPAIVPCEENLSPEIHFNPLMKKETVQHLIENHYEINQKIPEHDGSVYLKVKEDDISEWYTCKEHFMIKDGILFLLNQRNEKTENWISFSTGKILRPEIV